MTQMRGCTEALTVTVADRRQVKVYQANGATYPWTAEEVAHTRLFVYVGTAIPEDGGRYHQHDDGSVYRLRAVQSDEALEAALLEAYRDPRFQLTEGQRRALDRARDHSQHTDGVIAGCQDCLDQRCELTGGIVSILPRFAWKG